MRTMIAFLFLMTATAQAADFEITPAIQAELEKGKAILAAIAAEPAILAAVQEQNKKGPLPGMDNAKWKLTLRTDPIVEGFRSNPAGQFLRTQISKNRGTFNEIFLSAANGEKVAFAEKTTRYIHKGNPKFDVPFNTGKPWQGGPEFDESSQTYAIQIAVPVMDQGKTIGVLVAGMNLSHLSRSDR